MLLKFQNLWNLINVLIEKHLWKKLFKCFLWFFKVQWVQENQGVTFLVVHLRTLLPFTLSYTFAKSNLSITNGWLVLHYLRKHCPWWIWIAKMQISPYLLPPWRLVIASFEKFLQKFCKMHLTRWSGTNCWNSLYM
jgi:hypothetical protein